MYEQTSTELVYLVRRNPRGTGSEPTVKFQPPVNQGRDFDLGWQIEETAAAVGPPHVQRLM